MASRSRAPNRPELRTELPTMGERAGVEPVIRVVRDMALDAFFHAMSVYFAAGRAAAQGAPEAEARGALTGILLSRTNPALRGYFRSLAANATPSLEAIMEAIYHHNLPLTAFAKMCHRSLSSFKRDFRKHYGTSPGRRLLEHRLERSVSLLQATRMSVPEVMLECGFEDPSHFSKMHDALSSIVPSYRRYALTGPMQPLAQPAAAAAQAAHDVLVHIYPAQQERLGSALTTSLSGVPDAQGKPLGIQLGKDAAAAIISRRSGDGWDATGSYVPDPARRAGRYQFVPPLDFVFRPMFGDAKPFGIDNGAQFRAVAPPDLSGADYAAAYDEVMAFGAASGSARSEDQSDEARWWYENAEIGWNRISTLLAREQNLDLQASARLFALVNMGLADTYVASWNAKRHYDGWRPYTAIRAGDMDDNSATEPNPGWEPFCVTPPTWEYPSAHAMQSAAAAEMLTSALGTDSVSFTASSTTAVPERPLRSFTNLRSAAVEAADSRVMCGIHFRFATDAGLQQGRALAQDILQQHLRPIHPAPTTAGRDVVRW